MYIICKYYAILFRDLRTLDFLYLRGPGFFLGSKITADGDCSHEIKRRLLLGRKVITNLDSILKSGDIILPTKICMSELRFVFFCCCLFVFFSSQSVVVSVGP